MIKMQEKGKEEANEKLQKIIHGKIPDIYKKNKNHICLIFPYTSMQKKYSLSCKMGGVGRLFLRDVYFNNR